MQLLNLCSFLTCAVLFARAMPNVDQPIKCRLRDSVPASGEPIGCTSCVHKNTESKQSSTFCSSSTVNRVFVSSTRVATHALSSTPCPTSTSLVADRSTPCLSCQFTRTSNQDTTPDIPATQTKIFQSPSSRSVGTSSRVDTTESVTTTTFVTDKTSTSIVSSSGITTPSTFTNTSESTSTQYQSSQTISTTTAVLTRLIVTSSPSVTTSVTVGTPAFWNPRQPQPPPPIPNEPAPPPTVDESNPTPPNVPAPPPDNTPPPPPNQPRSRPPARERPPQLPSEPEAPPSRRSPTDRRPPSRETPPPTRERTPQPPSDRRPPSRNTPPPPPNNSPPPTQSPPPQPPAPAPDDPQLTPVSYYDFGSCCASPLVFDVNYDWRVQVKFGTGIWLDPSNVTELHAGADGGDVMLAMPDMNGNGQIDIEEVFGNRTLSPFTNMSYKAANGFEALHMLAIEADNQPLCTEKSANPKDKSVLVSLPKLKACLQKYGHDLGFISGDNVKVLQPLNQVDTVDVVDYVETPDDCKGGTKHAQKGHYYDKAGHEWRVDDVWFMTGTPYSKGLI
ncbi:hypothetical protein MP228_005177 [Amoeboaphelidium protococcarum]|nr:hypothetical protein MP228_005177 [Amoeboaphelidium protococcarum]